MADKKIYRRCGNCGAVLKPGDRFCPQCGVGTERSYMAGEPSGSRTEQRYQDFRYQRGNPEDRDRRSQGNQGDRAVYPQGSQGDGAVYPQGNQRDGAVYPQGSQRDRAVYPQGNQGDRAVYPQGSQGDGSHYLQENRRRESVRQESRTEKERYRQENLEGSWTEDWGRPVDENRVTAMQCVLIVLLVILLLALLALGGFWLFGRSVNRSAGQRGEQQDTAVHTEQESVTGDIVTILDPNTGKPVTAEKQTDAAARTEEESTDSGEGTQTGETGRESSGDTQTGETSPESSGDTQTGETGPESSGNGTESETAGSQSGASDQQDAQGADTAASWSQPESSSRLLTDDDLDGLTYDELQMAINEIYARHGRIFKTPEIGSYFESQSWYEGTLDADHFDESVFSAVEAQNIQIILQKMGDG